MLNGTSLHSTLRIKSFLCNVASDSLKEFSRFILVFYINICSSFEHIKIIGIFNVLFSLLFMLFLQTWEILVVCICQMLDDSMRSKIASAPSLYHATDPFKMDLCQYSDLWYEICCLYTVFQSQISAQLQSCHIL